ncbi:Uncharacterised protein [Klebsiella pneumoniae]|nr:Uncharacterised protein [Klebsiella pneumoniae]
MDPALLKGVAQHRHHGFHRRADVAVRGDKVHHGLIILNFKMDIQGAQLFRMQTQLCLL